MGLLEPGALLFLAITPLLLVAYMVRERPRRLTVSSVLTFRALGAVRGQRFGGRPRLDWRIFAELAILCLAALAMARPYLERPGGEVAVLLDNSAVMQARTGSGETRFQTALAKLSSALSSEPSSEHVTVFVTTPRPAAIAPAFSSPAAALRALRAVSPTDMPDNFGAVRSLLDSLLSRPHMRRIFVAGAFALAGPSNAKLYPITVAQPIPNYAIGPFSLRRETFGAAVLHARVTVANFSPSAQTLTVAIDGDGKPIASANTSLGAGQTATVEFPALAPAALYRARLAPDDGFGLDNVAYAAASSIRTVRILFVTPTAADAAGLGSLPGVSLTVRSPSGFSPADLEQADLAIFEYGAPKELPAANTLLVVPPPSEAPFEFEVAPTSRVEIAGWRLADPLTDAVNFRLLNVGAGEYFGVHPWMAAVVSGAMGGLILRGGRADHRFVALGFNPFPYLGKRNLPMSVLTLNVLSYLAGLGSSAFGYRTGTAWMVPAGVTSITTPSGKTVAVKAGTVFPDTTSEGVYRLTGPNGEVTLRAVNLADLTASDLENIPTMTVAAPAPSAAAKSISFTMPLSDYLLMAIVALAMLEAVAVYRRRRPAGVEL